MNDLTGAGRRQYVRAVKQFDRFFVVVLLPVILLMVALGLWANTCS